MSFIYRNYIRENGTGSNEPHRYVIDRTLGTEYYINLNSGQCRIRNMLKYSPNPESAFDFALDFISQFIQNKSFLPAPNSNFIFQGEQRANGVPSSKYIANVNRPDLSSSYVYEYRFSEV